MITPYPLCWPEAAFPRTPAPKRKEAAFKVSFAAARDGLVSELALMGATEITLSSWVPIKRDGMPYANFTEPQDPGVALYFTWKGNYYALACDRWLKVRDNLRAIGLHIAALRGQERWGVGSIDQAFAGYLLLNSSQAVDGGEAKLEV